MSPPIEKSVRGFRLKKFANGNIQVYAKQRSRELAAKGIKHSAWRLAFELTPTMIADLHAFSKEPPTPTPITGNNPQTF